MVVQVMTCTSFRLILQGAIVGTLISKHATRLGNTRYRPLVILSAASGVLALAALICHLFLTADQALILPKTLRVVTAPFILIQATVFIVGARKRVRHNGRERKRVVRT